VGVYKTEEGKAYVLPSVKEVLYDPKFTGLRPWHITKSSIFTSQAKNRIFNDPDWHHEYRPSALGSQIYRDLSVNLLFGRDHRLVREKR
jgi:aspartate aminotransferase